MRLVGRKEMIEIDRAAMEDHGIASWTLMSAASRALADAATHLFRAHRSVFRAVAVCGRGHNGADAMLAARILADRGLEVFIALLDPPSEYRGEVAKAHATVEGLPGASVMLAHGDQVASWRAIFSVDRCIILDGMLGTAATASKSQRAPQPEMVAAMKAMAEARKNGSLVLSVDLPSGMDADTGRGILGGERGMVEADETVTMGLPKIGLFSAPGALHAGRVWVAPLPYPKELTRRRLSHGTLLDAKQIARTFPKFSPDSHKGSRGTVLAVGGSASMPGALGLCVSAALRGGAGKVRAIVPDGVDQRLSAAHLECMWQVLSKDQSGQFARPRPIDLARAMPDRENVVLAVGPGMGVGPGARSLMKILLRDLATSKPRPIAMVFDADALNILASDPGLQRRYREAARKMALVMTPHPGEAARLLGWKTTMVQQYRLEAARSLQRLFGGWVILKGFRTLIAGQIHMKKRGRVFVMDVNPSGNRGLGKGGSGDVLAGLCAARIALRGFNRSGQRLREALCEAVYVHGRCGDCSAKRLGQESMLPHDLLDDLPRVLQQLARSAAS